jgi:hypothetical protein
MPEFILNTDNAPASWHALDEFTQGFIEAMFFTEQSPDFDSDEWFDAECQRALMQGTSDGQLPGDIGVDAIHPDSLAQIAAFCGKWKAENAEMLAAAVMRDGYDWSRAGNDFWYTSQGHGVGYWDRSELDAGGLGDALSDAARHREIHPFFGNHIEHGNAPFVHVDLY